MTSNQQEKTLNPTSLLSVPPCSGFTPDAVPWYSMGARCVLIYLMRACDMNKCCMLGLGSPQRPPSQVRRYTSLPERVLFCLVAYCRSWKTLEDLPKSSPTGHTPEVFGSHLSIILIYDSKIKTYAVVYSWGCRSPRVGEDLGRSSNFFHDLQYATSQNNTRSGREVYLRTCDGGL